MQKLSPDESCIYVSLRIVDSTRAGRSLDRRHSTQSRMLDESPSIARQVEGASQENRWSWPAITTKTKVSRESATDIPKDLAMSETPDVKNTGRRTLTSESAGGPF